MSTTAESSGIPRDPGFYRLSMHANQRRKERDIRKREVAQAIREGEVRRTHEAAKRLFVVDIAGADERVGVVANTQDGEICTVMWRA